MNNYFTLRRANRLRVKLLNSKSQEQIREVIRYLRRTSWDECGVELIYRSIWRCRPMRMDRNYST